MTLERVCERLSRSLRWKCRQEHVPRISMLPACLWVTSARTRRRLGSDSLWMWSFDWIGFVFLPLPGPAAVLWDGWQPGAGPVRGASEGSVQQLRWQRRRLAVSGGAVRPVSVPPPGRRHPGSAGHAAAEPGQAHRQGECLLPHHWTRGLEQLIKP